MIWRLLPSGCHLGLPPTRLGKRCKTLNSPWPSLHPGVLMGKTTNWMLGDRYNGLEPPPLGVEIFLVTSCYRNWDKLRPDRQLCSYADFTYYLLFLSREKFDTVESKLACVKGRGKVRELIPHIDLIPCCKLFLDIASRLPVRMCSWSLVLANCASDELKLCPKCTVNDHCFVNFSIANSEMILLV